MTGNTGVGGGTEGASQVPEKPTTAPDQSTVLEPGSPLVTSDPPLPASGEQNRDYRNGDERGVDDDGRAVG